MPPVDMISPARMKNGMASSGNELLVESMRWATISRLIPLIASPMTAERPSATAIGTRKSIRRTREPKSAKVVMSGAPGGLRL